MITNSDISRSKIVSRGGVFYKAWLVSLLVMLCYSLFIQYGIKSIDNAMLLLAGINIAFAFYYVVIKKSGRLSIGPFYMMIVFVFLTVIISLLFASGGEYGFGTGIRMIEYLLIAYSAYLLLKERPEYMKAVFGCIVLSVFALAIFVLIKGDEVTSSGAVGLASLNVNLMSSFFIMMTFCAFALISMSKAMSVKLILGLSMLLVFFVQIESASRRGFLVLTAMWILSILFAYIPFKYRSKKKTKAYVIFAVISVIVIFVSGYYLLNNTVLGDRLQGEFNFGDELRAEYQAFAWSQFCENPWFGIGIDGISYHIGVYSHSMYYELLSCTGIVMTFVFLFSIALIMLKLIQVAAQNRKRRYQEFNSYWAILAIVYLLAIMASGISVVMIYDYCFYVSIALIAAIQENANKSRFSDIQ